MGRSYTHLQPEERLTLAALHQQGHSRRAIARQLGRSASTICRELARNTGSAGYASRTAQAICRKRRKAAKHCKLRQGGPLWAVVAPMLHDCWSPRQIARTLKLQSPDGHKHYACPETIYRAIYAHPTGQLKSELIALLRQGRNRRRPRTRGKDRRGIADMASIKIRPPAVDERVVPGHWEADLIKGTANKSAVGVLLERKSRFVLLCQMPDASAASALTAFSGKLDKIPVPLRQTLTCDQGREMTCHKELSKATGMKIYFCDPHSPWQKGSCENMNGLLRQFLPKQEDLSLYSQQELDIIADKLNNRPRQILDWRSPHQVFADFLQTCAL